MNELIISGLVICLAFFGESIFGFGGGLVSIPLLSFVLGVKDAVTLALVFQLLMGLLIFHNYKMTNWKVAIPMTAGLIIGGTIGTFTLSLLSNVFLERLLAITIFIFLIKMIFFNGFTFGDAKHKGWGILAGLVGGWIQGVIGTGGPILSMYLAVAAPEKSVFRATLIFLLFMVSVTRIVTSFGRGLLTPHIIYLSLPILPFFIIAIFVGHFIHAKIAEKYYRYAIYIILFSSAISMLLKN